MLLFADVLNNLSEVRENASTHREGKMEFQRRLKFVTAIVENERELTREIEKDCQATLRVHQKSVTINFEWHQ